ncbi:uncharacterized protein LOC126740308 [Anthonomus grandis grandis]|uniref:uncharacterized protein LOC126740308 n=1 Tax=Anthonomus grandis grandis TaxID=2921223 RepID=UPI00216651B1|nr:uncharacterized protein LOC126740308 [Anthonomus grandis grandis]
MYKLLVLFALIATTFSLPYPLAEDEDGEQYHLVPLNRVRRQQQTNYRLDSKGNLFLGHKGTILDNQNHRLDGQGYVVKNVKGHGLSPDAGGGALNYLNKPSNLNLGVSADHVRHGGTNVGATAGWNFIQQKNAEVGLSGRMLGFIASLDTKDFSNKVKYCLVRGPRLILPEDKSYAINIV